MTFLEATSGACDVGGDEKHIITGVVVTLQFITYIGLFQ